MLTAIVFCLVKKIYFQKQKHSLIIDLFIIYSEQLLLEDAIQLLTEARNIVKRYAIVHIASAELEVKEGKHLYFVFKEYYKICI